MPKAQIFFILLVSFIGGVAAGSWLAFSQFILYLLFIPPIILIALCWRRNWRAVFIAFMAVIFLVGILRTFDVRLSTTFLKQFAETNFSSAVYGYVDSEIKHTAQTQQFVLRVKKLSVPDFTIPEKLDEKVLVSTENFPEYKYGDFLVLTGKIVLPKNFQDFDYISYLAKDQIYTIMNRPGIELIHIPGPTWDVDKLLGFGEKMRIGLFKKIFGLKNRFEKAVGLSVPEPQAAFINGILLGSRQDIPQNLKDDFAETGVTHILAISGYNITLVSLVVMWFLLFFMRRKTAFWFSVLAIILFTILTGASASVIRSALMGGLVLLANNSGRIYNPKNSLTLAAFLMVLANPMILRYDIGFQLSFFATLGILYVAPLFHPYLKKLPNWLNFRETFLMTFSAQLMVLPLLLFYFRNFSLVALPANLIILPFIPLAMASGFFTGIAGLIWSKFGLLIGALSWLVSSFVLVVVKFFANLPFASFPVSFSWLGMILVYAVIILFLIYLRKKKKEVVS
ncbi:MAG: ComEC/Rec2 family competence protein [bacterium]|nr:ComEC/Rec2 family competence protein [bacterium]